MSNKAPSPTANGSQHIFESAGLGKAPYSPRGVTTEGGQCQYCGTPIVYRFYLEGTDKKTFYVGSDCIKDAGDKGLWSYVEQELSKRRKEQAGNLLERKAAAVLLAIEDPYVRDVCILDKHPNTYHASIGKTYWDYIQFFLWAEQQGRYILKNLEKIYSYLVSRDYIDPLPRANARAVSENDGEKKKTTRVQNPATIIPNDSDDDDDGMVLVSVKKR